MYKIVEFRKNDKKVAFINDNNERIMVDVPDDVVAVMGTEKFPINYWKYDPESKKLYFDNVKIDEDKQLENLLDEKAKIENWFSENDWKVNKFILGEWTQSDSRWIEYKETRDNLRKRLEEIEDTLLTLE